MDNLISVHDNHLLGYEVDDINARIIFRTEYPQCEGERTNVVWDGVMIYHFECDLFKNIIFDIEETDAINCLDWSYSKLFARLKKYGWPPIRYETREDLIQVLEKKHIRG